MHFSSMAHVLGLIGITPVRAFLPAFLTALVIRIGGIPYLTDAASTDAAGAPSWFTHTYTLIILGFLSLLEIVATKSPEARQLLSTIDEYYKPALAAFTSFGVISASDASAVEALYAGTVATSMFPIAAISVGSVSLSFIFSTLTATGTYFVCTVRSALLLFLDDFDSDDSMGIQSLLSWAGDAWVAVLVVLLLLVPVFILFFVGLSLAGLWLFRIYMDRRAESAKVDCPNCGTKVLPFATACHACRTSFRDVVAIGVLGQMRAENASDITAHRLRLISLKKCPQCGSRLNKKTLHQNCEVCAHCVANENRLPDSYLQMVHARLPLVLLISGLLSAIPVVGMIPAIVYYRIALVSPFRAYITLSSSFASRWLSRIVAILLLTCFSWVPVLSTFTAPVLAYLSYSIYRRAFLRQWYAEKRAPAILSGDTWMNSEASPLEISRVSPVVAKAAAGSAERHIATEVEVTAAGMVAEKARQDAPEGPTKKLPDTEPPTRTSAAGTYRVVCPSCRHKLRAPSSMAGRKAKCSKCSAVVLVPRVAPVASEPSSPQPPPKLAQHAEAPRVPVSSEIVTAELIERESLGDKAGVTSQQQINARKDSERTAPILSTADEIRKLKMLLDEGILTTEEFTQKKRQLLGL